MTIKSIRPPKAFFDFAKRMLQDVDFLDSVEDMIRFGLQGIPRERLDDFISFVRRVENREIGDVELEGLRIFLTRARALAEKEGLNGILYKKDLKWNMNPSSKDLI